MIIVGVKAIGIVEVNFYSNTVVVLDEMLKVANVNLVSCHKLLGGRMVHSVIEGTTSDVNASMEAARRAESKVGEGTVKVAVTISNPHAEIIKLMNMLEEKMVDQ